MHRQIFDGFPGPSRHTMKRMAKRAIATAAAVLPALVILAAVLTQGAHGQSVQGPAAPPRSGGGDSVHHASGSSLQPPTTTTPVPPSGPSSSAPTSCDHGQHRDQGKCLGHEHVHGSDMRGHAKGGEATSKSPGRN